MRSYAHGKKTRHGTSGVIGMDGGKEQMSGERGLNRNFGRFKVTNFSHHDDVRVLAENRAQAFSKRILFARFNLALVQALHFILNRVFERNNFCLMIVQAFQNSVQRGGLTASRWTSGYNHAVWTLNLFGQTLLGSCSEAQFFKIKRDGVRIQETHDHAFPKGGRNGGKTDINLFVLLENGKPAVLCLVCDIDFEAGDEFNATDEPLPFFTLQFCYFLQNAVHAKTNYNAGFFRLNMNVRGSELQRGRDDNSEHVRDRGFSENSRDGFNATHLCLVSGQFILRYLYAFDNGFDFWERGVHF